MIGDRCSNHYALKGEMPYTGNRNSKRNHNDHEKVTEITLCTIQFLQMVNSEN